MSILDNALQALFKMAHKELLWENASPKSSFPAQDITVPCAEYDMILILYNVATTTPTYMVSSLVKCVPGNYAPAEFVGSIDSSSAVVKFHFRNSVLYASKIAFVGGNSKESSNYAKVADNTTMIPIYVYGLKLSGGGSRLVRYRASLLSFRERRWA